MIITDVTVGGTTFNDYQRAKVSKSIDQNNSSSHFEVTYDSPFGRHATDFSVGQELILKADDVDGTTTLLTGIIERLKFEGQGNSQRVNLIGRDYSQRLQDSTIDPVIFTNSEVSAIVTNIINNNVDDITTTNVNTTETTLKRIVFNHTPVFDALKQLAELSGFFFYVDNDKDLHFEKRSNVSSGIILNNTNVKDAIFNQTREGMSNDVTVYGDRVLAGFDETFTADGAGSVFTLIDKPRDTSVKVNNNIQKGGVFELVIVPVSGPEYLVNFNDKKIIFVSGTDIGYNSIPGNGSSVLVEYNRDIPIVKTGIDRESIKLFGRKEKIINDKSINDPNTAVSILKAELSNSNPFKGVEVEIKGWYSITPGNTAQVVIPDFNIDETVGILNATYTFDKNTIQSESVIKIRLNKKIKDLTDEITNLRSRLNALESADRQITDQITRLERFTQDMEVVGSIWKISTRTQTGSSLYLSDSLLTYASGLASGTIQGVLAGSPIGSPYGLLTLQRSGGFWT